MTLKQAIEMGIQMGMKTFSVRHFSCNGKTFEQTADTIFQFIEGYEDAIVMTCYFGSYYSCSIPSWHYQRPDHCHFIYRLADENIPTNP
jgi:hypothetical protein